MTDRDEQLKELRRRWDLEWGPAHKSPWKRRLAGIFIIVAFLAILIGVVLTAPR